MGPKRSKSLVYVYIYMLAIAFEGTHGDSGSNIQVKNVLISRELKIKL